MSLLNALLVSNGEASKPDNSNMPLAFKNVCEHIIHVTIEKSASYECGPVYYRSQSTSFEWKEYTFSEESSTTVAIFQGETMEFKANLDQAPIESHNFHFYIRPIQSNLVGKVECSGNLMSLFNFSNVIPAYGLKGIFQGCNVLTSLPEIYASEVGDYGLQYAFQSCKNIESAPDLSTIKKAGINAFQGMFSNCEKLKVGPKNLNIEEIKDYACEKMFYGCTSLTNAPKIVATKVGSNGCNNMFYDCYDLKNVPSILPATELGDQCYYNMFCNCTSITEAPILPATELSEQCYASMFYGCTALVNAPDLPAESLPAKCYASMFYNCTSLVNAPDLPAQAAPEQCYYRMFYNCTSLQRGPNLPATQLATSCYENMFYGCTSMTNGPGELPAEYLPAKCYASMFYNCSSLLRAPEIFATSWESGTTAQVMRQMFNNCKALNWMKVHFTSWPSSTATMNWVGGVPATGTFVKPTALTESFNARSIPTGWTVENF